MNLWEQHCCLPLVPTADITELARYPLGSYVSVKVGFSPHSKAVVTALTQDFRRKALADGRFSMVDAVDEPDAAELITLAFDHEDFNHELRIHPEAFSEMYTRWGPLQWVPPEGTLTLPAVLRSRGFDDKAVDAVFGGNFRRVAQAAHAATGR